MGKKACLKDIAAQAGVSVVTASRAIRGVGRVSEETQEHVRQIAEAMGYKRHQGIVFARKNLISDHEHKLRVLLPHFVASEGQETTVHSTRLLDGLRERIAEEQGEFLTVAVRDLADLLARFPRKRIHGIVLRQVIPSTWVKRLQEIAPVVYAISHDVQPGVDCVYFNEYKSAALLLDCLINHGHRQVAWIAPDITNLTAANVAAEHYDFTNTADLQAYNFVRARYAAWQTIGLGCKEPGVIVHSRIFKVAAFDSGVNGRRIAREFLRMREQHGVTALVTISNGTAQVAINALEKSGLKVPQDVSVAAYLAANIDPHASHNVTCVQLPFHTVGKIVPELIQRRLADPESSTITITLDTTLEMGETITAAKPVKV